MEIRFAGIHHVTAIAGDPRENVDFYADVLGLRLVKKTVNFDDPGSYHLYYGDATGSPGTIMTFFAWPGAVRGRVGTGQVSATHFAVPEDSLGFWTERLVRHGVRFASPERRFDETVLAFADPDGMPVEIVARPNAASAGGEGWAGSTVPAEHALRAISGVTLSERERGATADLLTGFLGFEEVGEEGGRVRYGAGESFADVLFLPDGARGVEAVGTVHHVAWRAPDERTQEAWREEIEARGFHVTPVLDRNYFRSIYFREPGGVLFEIATDAPGFPVDEPVASLGESLKLPPWLEEDRPRIEASLPPITLPHQRGDRSVPEKNLDFAHRFVPAAEGDPNALLLLHGTGGDENDLLPLGRTLSEGAALLSPRGKVLENGMPRFFRRLAEGVFDEEDLKSRTHELAGFIEGAVAEYGLDARRLWAVGFSNGANIAASLLLLHPGLLAGAVLLRAMVPFEPDIMPDLVGTPVYLAAGRSDPIIPPRNTERLAELLQGAGATVTLDWQPGGHGIGPAEVEAARRWLADALTKTG